MITEEIKLETTTNFIFENGMLMKSDKSELITYLQTSQIDMIKLPYEMIWYNV